MDDLPVGRRVAYWRGRRKMSQQVFADRLGKSKSWVDKIERGVRRLDKFSVLLEIADVLQVDVARLIAADAPAQPDTQTGVDAEIDALRAALSRYDVALGSPRPARQIADISKAVTHGWLSYLRGDYARLLRYLPELLGDTQTARAEYRTEQAAGTLAEVYQIAAATLRKVGEPDLAWLAADRGMAAAADSGDQALAARAAVPLAGAVRDLGRPRQSMELCIAVAHRLAPPEPLQTDPERLAAYGSLLLQAAMGAAGCGDDPSVAELLDQAAEAAEIVGEGCDPQWTNFGPTSVWMVRVAAAVLLGEPAAALVDHLALTAQLPWRSAPLGRRADHLVGIAQAYLQADAPDAAGQALLSAERLAAAEVRSRPVAHRTLADVLRRSRRPDLAVGRLADELGVRV